MPSMLLKPDSKEAKAYDRGWDAYWNGDKSRPLIDDDMFEHWLSGYVDAVLADCCLDED
jgi:hypothetical protein